MHELSEDESGGHCGGQSGSKNREEAKAEQRTEFKEKMSSSGR